MSEYDKNENLIEVICSGCGITHLKNKYVYNRGIKLGRTFCCSRKCSAKFSYKLRFSKNFLLKKKSPINGHSSYIDAPFRYFYSKDEASEFVTMIKNPGN